MAEQYWIGDFFIDVSRNQITKSMQPQVIAPKALAVLTYLAENQGQVVSHDALLSAVWQDTIVSTNTLQRSIAQLRKALGDDGKGQAYIKTHAKQGYSLECEVKWHKDAQPTTWQVSNPSPIQDNHTDAALVNKSPITDVECMHTVHDEPSEHSHDPHPLSRLKRISLPLMLCIIMLMTIGYFSYTAQQHPTLSFSELRALTATDNKESAGIYSPDGQYIVFHRYSQAYCVNNIWAKNIETQQEFRLTKNVDTFGSHSFSHDGKTLAFIQTIDCSKPITQKKCYKLMSLDFHEAIKSAQSPRQMMECNNSEIRTPRWLNNNAIALLQKTSDRWKLINYSVSDNTTEVIYELTSGNIIYYDYSVADDLFAVTTVHEDGHYYIKILASDGHLISSHRIKKPPGIKSFRFITPNFSPLKEQLVFSTGKQLFTLSYDGEVRQVSLPLDEPMGTPIFHPNGERMLVIKGYYDSDIATKSLSPIAQENDPSIIERSNVGEANAVQQPHGELIAYRSERSGEDQIWLTDGNHSRQLSRFPMDTYIYGIDWSADGQSLLVNANNTLVKVELNSEHHPYVFSFQVRQLFQWDSDAHKALALVRVKGIIEFAELNLTDSTMRILTDKPVYWAVKSDNGTLVYLDHMERFWRSGPIEDTIIDALNNQGSDTYRFVIQNNTLYGVNDDLQLWSYSLAENQFKHIGELPKTLDYLTDINQTQLFMTLRISAKKEVAELLLK
ncbi:winged helix-turn-helix domain-containing protein [Pseudoalteromonas sp. MMG012]|uniref:winged helix-turn-helix domain-containing protein n=1 Tax=Pseudoalteromonas sp. MMG012 TaxID=2822686 RepID=UPI001B3A2207|nr:winged helix-turn-helix domain-containing protein [Pseudoalteromonas sp. MMG012]MBQ4852018.1 winged helix-turn-helix domain-containing protein [Pseudoalteromonas sp. MMG012]